MLVRCGSTLAHASSRTLAFELEDNEPDSELLAAASQRLDALLAAASGTLDTLVGLGFARAHGRASFVLYRGEQRVALEEFSPLVDAGAKQFSIRGRLLGDTTGALALVTQGPYGITASLARADHHFGGSTLAVLVCASIQAYTSCPA